MSDKVKFPHAQAMATAEYYAEQLRPLCERIEIAGSLRRGKPEVGDIEILYVPKFEAVRDGLFDTKQESLADKRIEQWFSGGWLGKRLNKVGFITWGEKNKLAIDSRTKIPIDFFCTTPKNWWVSLVIRTGSKETNLRLTTGAQELGRSLEAYGSGVRCFAGEPGYVSAMSEEDVFKLCGVPYLEPYKR